ncbi:hypothetical protein [Campylobacter geochelonis]|uniref:hypothetical protein n=1 Tax=Campylobacter geochelonis TaxID=1780362 RepID=UPI0007709526|nr:hypothetical protein [Campylobacter geochelonis]CZE46171.1 Uncharacterised protein [Campylobacter geochelonis]
MSLKTHLLSVFRGIFVFHHRSLEFRAKIFAAMLLAKKEIVNDDYKKLIKITKEIYKNDNARVGILINTVKEYVKMAETYKNFSLDTLLKDIDKELKVHKRYASKINFEHLRMLISTEDEDDALVQQRVYEFFVNEVKIYSN